MLRTFDEWSASGFKIKKGVKAVGKNEAGVSLFSIAQVIPFTQWFRPSRHSKGIKQKENKPYREPNSGYYNDEGDFIVKERCFNSDEYHTVVYHQDGSGYVEGSGPCGPLYFDRNGDT